MNPIVRIALALVLVGGVVTGGLLLRGDGADASTDVADATWTSSRQCMECHREVWDEWWGSHHQISYLNPEVRKLSDDFRNKECQACHLPRPVAVTGFAQRTLPRQTRPDEGVGCLTCHLGADGGILGSRDLPDVPCKPRRDEQFVSVDQCASCHNQHWTTDQWHASDYPAKGIGCNDCHMPEVERQRGDAVVRGRGHVFHGAHHAETLRSAGTFEVTVEGGELVLSLTNSGAGHNFPTEERHRAVDIEYRFVEGDADPGDTIAWERAYRFRQPYRDEPGENTQLPAGETKTVRVAVPDGATRVEARLWYRLNPFATDDDPASTLLFEREVALR